MKRFKRALDALGNYYTIIIRDDNSVIMSNQNGISCSLASVYNGPNHGHEAACKVVATAALGGLASIERVSGYKWTELPPAACDLTDNQKDQIRSAMNELFNGIAEDCELSVDQSSSAKAFMVMLLNKQPPSALTMD